LSLLASLYLGLGVGLGVLGVFREQQEIAASAGILNKALAWYLAPSLTGLSSVQKYFLSVTLAGVLEYPLLTYSNTLAFQTGTGMRLRAFQDFVDILATFGLVAVAGIGPVDAFTISQNGLALLRVGIAYWGPRVLLPRPTQRERDLAVVRDVLPKLHNPPSAVQALLVLTPTPSSFRGVLVCVAVLVVGVTMGVVGIVVVDGPYVVGVAAVFGMSLAWYLGPSLQGRTFLTRWAISVALLLTVEYPFLSEANTRAAADQSTFELRAVQDLVGMLLAALLISVLGHVVLTRVDALQLAVGVLRVVVATRFFWTV
jgi:hypothetical protein